MSYHYNLSDDAPPTFQPHQLHASARVQADGRMYNSSYHPDQEAANVKYNAPSLHTPMVITAPSPRRTAPSPRRKQRATKPRRADNRAKPSRDRGASDRTSPMTTELTMLLRWCRSNEWTRVLQSVQANPYLALETLTMGNYISTTILHQAISSKGDIEIRANVISTILSTTPEAAKMTNGYGSMSLHAIAQRNLKMDSQTKERLMIELVHCHKDALISNGGIGGRTPLHIIFTDYVSPKLTKFIIENGPDACFMKDNKGCLPAHIACMRHCSPEKLRMLLAVNPAALHAVNDDNKTLLDLAKSKATQAHPNYALIDELQKQLAGDVSHYDPIIFNTPPPQPSTAPSRLHYCSESNDNIVGTPAMVSIASHHSNHHHNSNADPSFTNTLTPNGREYHYNYPYAQQPYQRQYHPHPAGPYHSHQKQYEDHSHHSMVGRVSSEDEDHNTWNRSHIDSNETWISPIRQHHSPPSYFPPHRFSYRQDGGPSGGAFDAEPAPTYRPTLHHYTPPYAHFRTPHEFNSLSRRDNGRKIYDAPTPAWEHTPKAFSMQGSIKSEEPAAKLLLHFSRNLNTNADDNVGNGSDAQEDGSNHSVRANETHHFVQDDVMRETENTHATSLDVATASRITEV